MIKLKFGLMLAFTFLIAQYLNQTAYSLMLYSAVTLPGTFLHELAHYVTALVMDGNPGNFNLIPSGRALGSITFYPNWYNAAAVALSPLLLAPMTAFFALIAAKADSVQQALLGSYFAACSWVACTPSPQDFSIALNTPTSWPVAALFLGLATYLVYRVVHSSLTR
jgi:hypothetical protein